MKPYEFIAWPLAVILALGFGIFVGFKVQQGIADTEIMDLRAQLETANASLAEVNVEPAFWKNTLRSLANGDQLEGAELNGRPSLGD